MFTIEQIKTAHSKVRSGADFPAYINEIKQLGVTYYETFVTDGHTDYSGANGYSVSSAPRYELLPIAAVCPKEQFALHLKEHQQGKSDYTTFIKQCAQAGVYKWAVSMEDMTCTYYDKTGNEILTEQIPQP